MIEMPELWELIALFECEPVLADTGVPPSYNTLNFRTTRGADELWCQISPYYGDVYFTWSRQGSKVLDLKLHSVQRLYVSQGDCEALEISFEEQRKMDFLRLQFKPNISIQWGMNFWD
ncbi:MAG TPA: hypothetical protein VGQ99_10685 [Tepidisphaeraceae bacterium]|jgi:hypothetical protein|nr:hypothetical protein [Tepidisphaeraceae bacterium]